MAEQTWQEAAAEIWDLFKETDTKFKETDLKFKETDQKLRRLEGLFGMQWGRMMEALVEPAALNLFRERDIDVHTIAPRIKHRRNGHTLELDLVLENEGEVVILEVKSALRVQDVQDFLVDLSQLFDFVPRYRSYKVYAGVVGLEIMEDADRYAHRQGLFVLSFTGEGVVQIKNGLDFRPKDFAAK